MKETEATLQQFGEFLLRRRLVRERAAPHCVRWVRRFLALPASTDPLADRVRSFCEELERDGGADWQARQAGHALSIYFRQFLGRADWSRSEADSPRGTGMTGVDPLRAMASLRQRMRTRHYAYRTEQSYTDWARRFFAFLAEQQATQRPRISSQDVQAFLTHLAVRRHVSAGTQNQALSALLFLCRDVLELEVDGLSRAVKARRGTRLPVVLSVAETTALLGVMRDLSWLGVADIRDADYTTLAVRSLAISSAS